MYNLIMKDFMLHKKFFIFYLLLVCTLLVAEYSFVAVTVIIGYSYVLNAHTFDNPANSNHGHKLMNSLPYTRKQIVLAKYIAPLLVTVVVMIYIFIIQLLLHAIFPSHFEEIGTKKDMWSGFIIILLFTSFFLPTFYFFRNPNLLAVFAFVMLPVLILWSKIDQWLQISTTVYKLSIQFSILEVVTFVSIVIMAAYTASYLLTVRIYERTDF